MSNALRSRDFTRFSSVSFRVLPWLIFLLVTFPAQALEVIPIYWQDAAEMAQALRPQLQSGEKLSVLDGQLILDASPERSAQLQRLIAQLDKKPQMLRLEVEQNGALSRGQSSISIAGKAVSGGWSVSTGQPPSASPGGRVVISNSNEARQSSTQQSLQILEGRAGFIEIGVSRPLPWLMFTPQGRPLLGVRMDDAITGFYARPRRAGNRVIVELAAREEAFSSPAASTTKLGSRLSTTVEGPIGEWLDVGGVGRDEQGREQVLIGVGQNDSRMTRRIRIRVNLP